MEEHIIIYKNDSNEKYYKVPNALMKLNLSSGEIAVYNYLLFCEDRKTFKCHPSIKTIGKAIGMSKNTVVKYIRMLELRMTSIFFFQLLCILINYFSMCIYYF